MSATWAHPSTKEEVAAARDCVKKLCGNRVVPFHAVFGRLFGINAALLLAQLLYWSDKGADPTGWILKESRDWERELCLTYKQQMLARSRLKAAGVIEDRYSPGSDRGLQFRVRWDGLLMVLQKTGKNGASPTCPKGRSRHAERAGGHAQRAAPIHKSTQKSTGEEPPKSSGTEDFDAVFSTPPPSPPDEGMPTAAPHPKAPEAHASTQCPPVQSQQPAPPVPPAPTAVAADREAVPLANTPEGNSPDAQATHVNGATRPEFPAYNARGFPRLPSTNNPDWAAAIAKYDPYAQVLPELFPDFRWGDEPREARRYFNRRRNNCIRDRHLTLLQLSLGTTSGEQESPRGPRSVAELITGWPEIISQLEQEVAGELENLEVEITEFFDGDPDFAVGELARANALVKEGGIGGLQTALNSGLYVGVCWPVLVALALRGHRIELSQDLRAKVLGELAADETALEIFRGASIEHSEFFGFSPAQVDAARMVKQERLIARRNLMRSAIGQEPAAHASNNFSPPAEVLAPVVPVPTQQASNNNNK